MEHISFLPVWCVICLRYTISGRPFLLRLTHLSAPHCRLSCVCGASAGFRGLFWPSLQCWWSSVHPVLLFSWAPDPCFSLLAKVYSESSWHHSGPAFNSFSLNASILQYWRNGAGKLSSFSERASKLKLLSSPFFLPAGPHCLSVSGERIYHHYFLNQSSQPRCRLQFFPFFFLSSPYPHLPNPLSPFNSTFRMFWISIYILSLSLFMPSVYISSSLTLPLFWVFLSSSSVL